MPSAGNSSEPRNPDADLIWARMARLPLYAVFTHPCPGHDLSTPEAEDLLCQHLSWLLEMQDEGRLIAGGPLDYGRPPRTGDPIINASGVFIFAAASEDEAASIVAEESFTRAGWRISTIRTWLLNEGIVIGAARPAVDAFCSASHDPAIPAWSGRPDAADGPRDHPPGGARENGGQPSASGCQEKRP